MKKEAKGKRKIFYSLFLFFFLFLLVVKAQIYFGITPIRVEHKGEAGESITDIFYVRNNASSPIRLKVYTENWYLKPEGTPVFTGNEPVDYSCKDWIKVNPQDFRILPDEKKMVRYTVTIPQQVESGGYHASVSFESVPLSVSEAKKSRMMFKGKIAAVVYVKVGKTEPVGEIMDLKVSVDKESTHFKLGMKNQGQTHFRTKGHIQIRNSEGKKIHKVSLPNEVVLPQSEREIKCTLKEKLLPGSYEAFCKVDIGRRELLGFKKEFTVKNENNEK